MPNNYKTMEIKGKCIQVLPVISGEGKNGGWRKQEFVIETAHENYPKKVCLNLWGDNVDSCPTVGKEVTVSFDPESREYNGRWFTELRAWKVKFETVTSKPATENHAQPQTEDGLPF